MERLKNFKRGSQGHSGTLADNTRHGGNPDIKADRQEHWETTGDMEKLQNPKGDSQRHSSTMETTEDMEEFQNLKGDCYNY